MLKDLKLKLSSQASINAVTSELPPQAQAYAISELSPGAKNSSIFAPPLKNLTVEEVISSPENLSVNNKYKLSSTIPEILSVFSYTSKDIEPLAAAIDQAYFEDRCSLEFSKLLAQKIKQTNKKLLPDIVEKVNQEIKSAESQLSIIEQFVNTCFQVDSNLSFPDSAAISSRIDAFNKSVNLNSFGLTELGVPTNNPKKLIESQGLPANSVSGMSNTSVMTQLLTIAADQMTFGSDLSIFGENNFSVNGDEAPLKKNELWPFSFSFNPSLKNFSAIGSDGKRKNYLLNFDKNESWTDIYQNSRFLKFQMSAHLMSLLSNELSISTGIGRLNAIPLGNSFFSTFDYRTNFWGLSTTFLASTYDEVKAEGSLTDYFVVNPDGGNRAENTKILLFDGSNTGVESGRTNAFDAFVAGSIRNPTIKSQFSFQSENSVEKFSTALSAAQSKFETGRQFFNVLHCRDKQIPILTPRGLFSRLTSEFSKSIQNTRSNGQPDTRNGKRDSQIMSILSMLENSGYAGNQYLREIILEIMVKKAVKKLIQTDGSASNDSSSQKPQAAISKTKVTTFDKDGKPIDTKTVQAEDISESNKANPKFVLLNEKFPSFCEDETKLYSQLNNSSVPQVASIYDSRPPLLDLSFDQMIQSNPKGSGEFNLEIINHGRDILKQIENESDSFIDACVQIYADIINESLKACEEESKNASFVVPQRLTKNSKLDGTLMMSMILEAACCLASTFFDVKVKKYFSAVGRAQLVVVAGESDAARALNIISKASDSNDFASIFLPTDGGLIVPEMGSLSTKKVISVAGNDGAVSVNTIVDLYRKLSLARELPALCFSNVAGMVQYFYDSSQDYVNFASQLIGLTKASDDVKKMIDFAQTAIGSKYFSSLNQNSIVLSKKKISSIKNAATSESGRIPKLTLGELRCIKTLLSAEAASTTNKNSLMIVAGMPKDFLLKLFDVRNVKDVQGRYFGITVLYEENFITVTNPMGIPSITLIDQINSSSFSEFDSREPTGFSDIIDNVIFDGNVTGAQLKESSKSPVDDTLDLTVKSYLFKKLFSILSSVDLFSENIIDLSVSPVSENSPTIAKSFASVYGINPSSFDNVFERSQDGLTYADKDKLLKLTFSTVDTAFSNSNFSPSVVSFGEADLFCGIFESVFFKAGTIFQTVFAESILDDTFCFNVPPLNSNPKFANFQIQFVNFQNVKLT